ncbi:MAG: DsbC family protein [Pseudomonadota bacterium]
MFHHFSRAMVAVLALTLSMASLADVTDEQLDSVRQTIAEKFPRIKPESVNRSAIPGLLEIQQGVLVAYVSEDGRFLVQGEILDLENDTNLTEASVSTGRLEAMSALGADDGILFAPAKTLHTVTVFTDIDCTFCRKLHQEIQAYNDAGIAVRYVMYPRSGPNTRSWEKAEEVWCADDRTAALTKAKNSESLPKANCDASMIGKHFQVGLKVGLGGTPAIVTEDGTLFSGYVPAADLAVQLNLAQPAASR